jgi:hypothetical protein
MGRGPVIAKYSRRTIPQVKVFGKKQWVVCGIMERNIGEVEA